MCYRARVTCVKMVQAYNFWIISWKSLFRTSFPLYLAVAHEHSIIERTHTQIDFLEKSKKPIYQQTEALPPQASHRALGRQCFFGRKVQFWSFFFGDEDSQRGILADFYPQAPARDWHAWAVPKLPFYVKMQNYRQTQQTFIHSIRPPSSHYHVTPQQYNDLPNNGGIWLTVSFHLR